MEATQILLIFLKASGLVAEFLRFSVKAMIVSDKPVPHKKVQFK